MKNLSLSLLVASLAGAPPLWTNFDRISLHRSAFYRSLAPLVFNVPHVSLVRSSFSQFLSPVLRLSREEMVLHGMTLNSRQKGENVTATECLFTRVNSEGEGGVSVDSPDATASFSRCVFDDCYSGQGGAVYARCARLFMSECCASKCSANEGAFVFAHATSEFDRLNVADSRCGESVVSLNGTVAFKACNISGCEVRSDASEGAFLAGIGSAEFSQSLVHDVSWRGMLVNVNSVEFHQCNVIDAGGAEDGVVLLVATTVEINGSVFGFGAGALVDNRTTTLVTERSFFSCERPSISGIVDVETMWGEESPTTLELDLLEAHACDGFKPVATSSEEMTTEHVSTEEYLPTATASATPTAESTTKRVNFVSVIMVVLAVGIVLVVLGGLVYACMCRKGEAHDDEKQQELNDVNEPLNREVLNPVNADDGITKEMI